MPDGPRRVDAVDNGGHTEFFVVRSAFRVGLRVAVKRRGDEIVDGRVRQQVTGQLFDGEFIKWHVRVESADEPITVGPHVAVRIFFKTLGIGVAGQVHPHGRPAFPEMRRIEKSLDFVRRTPWILLTGSPHCGTERGTTRLRHRWAADQSDQSTLASAIRVAPPRLPEAGHPFPCGPGRSDRVKSGPFRSGGVG